MARESRPCLGSDLAHAGIAAAALSIALLIYGAALLAQDEPEPTGLGNPETTLIDYKGDPWAASTGFISIPSARALLSRPRWDDDAGAPISNGARDSSPSLAVVGLPIDLEHSMLQKNRADTYCLARQSATEQSVALCGKKSSEYTLLRSSKEYNLCGFTDDCWHSTAAALLAAGTAIDSRLFSFEAFAALPFKDGTKLYDVSDLKYPKVPAVYTSLQPLLAALKFSSESRDPTSVREELARRRTYARLPPAAFPLAALYQNEPECCEFKDSAPAFVNRNIVLRAGRRPGGPIYAFNVFSRVENQDVCAAAKRNAPCVLTNLVAQEKALGAILAGVLQDQNAQAATARPRIGAILIIAGGPLTDHLCDDTPTAQYISQLRQAGVYTFVPAGNDGAASQVRFPGCASDAVTIGALDRDGSVSSFSNGRATKMVKLYTDGDTLVLPTRALPVLGLACMRPETFTTIAKGYQIVLARLGYYQGSPSGALDAAASEAILRFQKATRGLVQSRKFDPATLLALEARARTLGMHDAAFTPVSVNIKAAGLPDLAAYQQYFCNDGTQENFYQAQFVGGTLVSASIAAGQFLSLLDQHKNMSTKTIFDSITRVAASNRTKELNMQAADAYLRSLESPNRNAQ